MVNREKGNEIKADKETWCTLSRASGNGNGSISGYMKANTGAERSVIITIIAGKEKAEFALKQLAGNGSNPDPDPEKPSGYAGRIEIPALRSGDMYKIGRASCRERVSSPV